MIENDGDVASIEEFTIHFDRNLFAALAVASSPADWDSLVVRLDPGLPADGFFDSLALIVGLADGELLGGFSVAFTFKGDGHPGSQPFDIVDPESFETIYSSRTVPGQVPEPTALLLILAGELGAVSAMKRRFVYRGPVSRAW